MSLFTFIPSGANLAGTDLASSNGASHTRGPSLTAVLTEAATNAGTVRFMGWGNSLVLVLNPRAVKTSGVLSRRRERRNYVIPKF